MLLNIQLLFHDHHLTSQSTKIENELHKIQELLVSTAILIKKHRVNHAFIFPETPEVFKKDISHQCAMQ